MKFFMKRYLRIFYLLLATITSYSQVPTISLKQCYGGSDQDWGRKIIEGNVSTLQTCIICGETKSDNDDILSNQGGSDIFWIRVDTSGAIINRNVIGGSDDDIFSDVIQGWNGGYILLGSTKSIDGNVTGNHGMMDIWLASVSNQGVLQWQKCFGGSNDDFSSSIIKTEDSCYVISARTMSTDGDISINHGLPNTNDFWLLKIDRTGNLLWQKTYGGPNGDYAWNAIQASDGGFIVCGGTFSDSVQVSGNHGSEDFWVIKTDSSGNLQWQKCYGGSSFEEAFKVVEKNNLYYIIGTNNSNDGDISGNHLSSGAASSDVWLICIDSTGSLQWQKSLGGSHQEIGTDLIYYNHYLFIGSSSSSNDGDVTNTHAISSDYWLMQLDTTGNIIWQNCYGGTDHEYLQSILLDNGKLYSVGHGLSNDGDISGNHGFIDTWLLRLEIDSLLNTSEIILPKSEVSFVPNPASSFLLINASGHFEVAIYDLQGRKVLECNGYENYLLDMRTITNGLYLIKIKYSNSNYFFNHIIINH